MTTYSELARIHERLMAEPAPTEDELAELAAALPSSLEGRPEAALLLAELYEQLAPRRREASWPAWRTAGLPARVQIVWLRAEIANDPAFIHTESGGELLYQALRQVHISDTQRPDRLVAEVAGSTDPVVQGEALRLAREGLEAARLSPALVRRHLVSLLASGDDDVLVETLGQLAEPWAALVALPPAQVACYLSTEAVATSPRVAEAALDAATRHGHQDTLWDVVENVDLPSSLRRRAMARLGDLAERDDIPALTALAGQDPLLFGHPMMMCLRGLHRRGRFVQDADVAAIVGIALADHTIPVTHVATILFTSRQTLFDELIGAPVDDPSWPRRLDLLVALDGQGRNEVPLGEAITRLLPRASRPEPFLAAIRALRFADAEDAVIALVPTAPEAALRTLEAIGGRRTVAALRTGLGLDPAEGGTTAIAPHLRTDRARALEILWHLTRDLAQRHALLDRLDPAGLPPRIAADLGGPDERELVLLRSHLDPDKPVAALVRLAAGGGVGTVPVIADLLLRIVAGLAASWQPGGPGWQLDSEPQTGEPVVPPEAVEAIRALGRRLHARRKIRPVCLLGAVTPQAAGDALVAGIALDLLDRPGLSAGETAILLELLGRVPSAETRPRVHRLLRHPDRHVRKHAIALIARDASGNDAQALSATLIRLTEARDVQTVRQALLALGRAKARWAAAAVAACLEHPAMNIKKTAAEVLVGAGSPTAVPKLLFWLGHHDNPGFRSSLVEALKAILHAAYAGTVIAAAESETDDHARRLLLSALDEELPSDSVLALEMQGSPAAPVLLALVANGAVGTSGRLDVLAAAFARHGIEPPAPKRPSPTAEADDALRTLLSRGWDPEHALRLAEIPNAPDTWILKKLRPLLADWLRLAASEPAARTALPRLFHAPWSVEDRSTLARFAPVLCEGLADAEGRDWFIVALAAITTRLSAVEKLDVIDAVRALQPAAAVTTADGSTPTTTPRESTLALLRAYDAVLVRADVDQALAASRLLPDPTRAEAAVLREAFTANPQPPAKTKPAKSEAAQSVDDAWRAELAGAIRTPGALAAFRRRTDDVPSSRDRLDALIDAFPAAGAEVRTALIDWMLALQPFDTPAWTITEPADSPTADATRIPHDGDLDQPRSAAQRDRLLTMLASPSRERRDLAARALVAWPEPDIKLAVLRPYLRGDIDESAGGDLTRAVRTLSASELSADGILPDRVILAASRLGPEDADLLFPLLLSWWREGSPALRQDASAFLRRADPDFLAGLLSGRLKAREWGYAELLGGRELLRTPVLTELCEQLRLEGRTALADKIVLHDGPLRGPDAKQEDAASLTALRDPARDARPPREPSREELLALARTGRPEEIRRALQRLVELETGPRGTRRPGQDPDLQDVLVGLLTHPRPGIRLQAHRTARQLLDRPASLRLTTMLLEDPHPDVLGTAIRTVGHAGWEPALPALVALLEHPHAIVRAEAATGLAGMGRPAAAALRRAADHARPDKRAVYTAVLDQVVAAGQP